MSKPRMHFVLDIETTGVSPGCGVLEIGLAGIKEGDNELEPETYFCAQANINSVRSLGYRFDQSTMDWWNKQEDFERFSVCTGSVVEMFQDLQRYLSDYEVVTMWGNGADFDQPILAAAMTHLGYQVPWDFHANRCFRTVKNLRSEEFKTAKAMINHETIGWPSHYAVCDARVELRQLLYIHDQSIDAGLGGILR